MLKARPFFMDWTPAIKSVKITKAYLDFGIAT